MNYAEERFIWGYGSGSFKIREWGGRRDWYRKILGTESEWGSVFKIFPSSPQPHKEDGAEALRRTSAQVFR